MELGRRVWPNDDGRPIPLEPIVLLGQTLGEDDHHRQGRVVEQPADGIQIVWVRIGSQVQNDRPGRLVGGPKMTRLLDGSARDWLEAAELEGDLEDPQPTLVRRDDEDRHGGHHDRLYTSPP